MSACVDWRQGSFREFSALPSRENRIDFSWREDAALEHAAPLPAIEVELPATTANHGSGRRLQEIAIRPEFAGASPIDFLGRGREHCHRNLRTMLLPNPGQDIEAVNSRHLQIQEDKIWKRKLTGGRKSHSAQQCRQWLPRHWRRREVDSSVPLERALHKERVVLIVLDQQKNTFIAAHLASCNSIQKRLPRGSLDSIPTAPPILSTASCSFNRSSMNSCRE